MTHAESACSKGRANKPFEAALRKRASRLERYEFLKEEVTILLQA